MNAGLLDVVAVVFNPVGWQSRIALYNQFEQHMLSSGVRLTTVECAVGGRPFQLSNPKVNHVKVRTTGMLWIKENLVNLGIARLPSDWKYVAWVDADVTFRQADWASQTVYALQHYQVIQPWSDVYELGPKGEHVNHWKSFLCQWWNRQPIKVPNGYYPFAHPGYAWAGTRQALDWVGGLVDTAILGAGDHHMSLALIGRVDESIPGGVTANYRIPLEQWQKRAVQHINYKLGYLNGSTIEHSWHGRPTDRKYIDRWSIIVNNHFDPTTDLKRNTDGVLELAGNKPELAHDIDMYFKQRNEDANSL
jgi:hypothetical protein